MRTCRCFSVDLVAPVTSETDSFAQLDHPLLQVDVWFEVWMGFPPPEELVCEWKLWIILEDHTAAEVLLAELHGPPLKRLNVKIIFARSS